ncbi:MAG: YdcF family protein [Pseudolabrys sp.]
MWSGLVRWIGLLTVLVGAAAAVLLACGFFWFVWQIPTEEVQLDDQADGIVVLTGAAARIPDAIELLADQRGKRLLITGVYRKTRASQIARLTPLYTKYFKCCIDLDRSALNTFGNALQTKRWASEHNFNSLIVVTSNWHMPRAMTEIRHELPQAKLIAYPVISKTVKSDPWWSNPSTARLLFREYLKYLFAQLRMRIDPDGAY